MEETVNEITQERPGTAYRLALRRRLADVFEDMAPKYRIMVKEETKVGLVDSHLQLVRAHGIVCHDVDDEC